MGKSADTPFQEWMELGNEKAYFYLVKVNFFNDLKVEIWCQTGAPKS